jgi:rubrerythrin
MTSWRNLVATLGVAALVVVPTASAARTGQHGNLGRPGLPGAETALAELFSGTAQVELREHFAGEAVLAGLVGSNATNLQDAISGETTEATIMYPGFAAQATADKCPSAATLFGEIAGDEAGHAAAYTIALQALTNPTVKVPKPPVVDPVVITASTPACPGTQTQTNLLTAMHGEAFAYAKYTAYAGQARRHRAHQHHRHQAGRH